jgi:hypothetical protein
MSDLAYSLSATVPWMHHNSLPVWYVADGEDVAMDRLELETHVRSGDYWSTLATRIDTISELLTDANDAERANLQRIVDELLYVERRYRLIKRD